MYIVPQLVMRRLRGVATLQVPSEPDARGLGVDGCCTWARVVVVRPGRPSSIAGSPRKRPRFVSHSPSRLQQYRFRASCSGPMWVCWESSEICQLVLPRQHCERFRQASLWVGDQPCPHRQFPARGDIPDEQHAVDGRELVLPECRRTPARRVLPDRAHLVAAVREMLAMASPWRPRASRPGGSSVSKVSPCSGGLSCIRRPAGRRPTEWTSPARHGWPNPHHRIPHASSDTQPQPNIEAQLEELQSCAIPVQSMRPGQASRVLAKWHDVPGRDPFGIPDLPSKLSDDRARQIWPEKEIAEVWDKVGVQIGFIAAAAVHLEQSLVRPLRPSIDPVGRIRPISPSLFWYPAALRQRRKKGENGLFVRSAHLLVLTMRRPHTQINRLDERLLLIGQNGDVPAHLTVP